MPPINPLFSCMRQANLNENEVRYAYGRYLKNIHAATHPFPLILNNEINQETPRYLPYVSAGSYSQTVSTVPTFSVERRPPAAPGTIDTYQIHGYRISPRPFDLACPITTQAFTENIGTLPEPKIDNSFLVGMAGEPLFVTDAMLGYNATTDHGDAQNYTTHGNSQHPLNPSRYGPPSPQFAQSEPALADFWTDPNPGSWQHLLHTMPVFMGGHLEITIQTDQNTFIQVGNKTVAESTNTNATLFDSYQPDNRDEDVIDVHGNSWEPHENMINYAAAASTAQRYHRAGTFGSIARNSTNSKIIGPLKEMQFSIPVIPPTLTPQPFAPWRNPGDLANITDHTARPFWSPASRANVSCQVMGNMLEAISRRMPIIEIITGGVSGGRFSIQFNYKYHYNIMFTMVSNPIYHLLPFSPYAVIQENHADPSLHAVGVADLQQGEDVEQERHRAYRESRKNTRTDAITFPNESRPSTTANTRSALVVATRQPETEKHWWQRAAQWTWEGIKSVGKFAYEHREDIKAIGQNMEQSNNDKVSEFGATLDLAGSFMGAKGGYMPQKQLALESGSNRRARIRPRVEDID